MNDIKEIFEKFEKEHQLGCQNWIDEKKKIECGQITFELEGYNQLKSSILKEFEELKKDRDFYKGGTSGGMIRVNKLEKQVEELKNKLKEKDEQLDKASIEIITLAEDNNQLKKRIEDRIKELEKMAENVTTDWLYKQIRERIGELKNLLEDDKK